MSGGKPVTYNQNSRWRKTNDIIILILEKPWQTLTLWQARGDLVYYKGSVCVFKGGSMQVVNIH